LKARDLGIDMMLSDFVGPKTRRPRETSGAMASGAENRTAPSS
jgi:hypothetical protein